MGECGTARLPELSTSCRRTVPCRSSGPSTPGSQPNTGAAMRQSEAQAGLGTDTALSYLSPSSLRSTKHTLEQKDPPMVSRTALLTARGRGAGAPVGGRGSRRRHGARLSSRGLPHVGQWGSQGPAHLSLPPQLWLYDCCPCLPGRPYHRGRLSTNPRSLAGPTPRAVGPHFKR